MELKEVVNLRKLRDYYEGLPQDRLCAACPFRDICTYAGTYVSCILVKMLGINCHSADLYEMLEDPSIPEDFQLDFHDCDY